MTSQLAQATKQQEVYFLRQGYLAKASQEGEWGHQACSLQTSQTGCRQYGIRCNWVANGNLSDEEKATLVIPKMACEMNHNYIAQLGAELKQYGYESISRKPGGVLFPDGFKPEQYRYVIPFSTAIELQQLIIPEIDVETIDAIFNDFMRHHKDESTSAGEHLQAMGQEYQAQIRTMDPGSKLSLLYLLFHSKAVTQQTRGLFIGLREPQYTFFRKLAMIDEILSSPDADVQNPKSKSKSKSKPKQAGFFSYLKPVSWAAGALLATLALQAPLNYPLSSTQNMSTSIQSQSASIAEAPSLIETLNENNKVLMNTTGTTVVSTMVQTFADNHGFTGQHSSIALIPAFPVASLNSSFVGSSFGVPELPIKQSDIPQKLSAPVTPQSVTTHHRPISSQGAVHRPISPHRVARVHSSSSGSDRASSSSSDKGQGQRTDHHHLFETRDNAVPNSVLLQTSQEQGQLVDAKTAELLRTYQDLPGPYYKTQAQTPTPTQPTSFTLFFPFQSTQPATSWSQSHGHILNETSTQQQEAALPISHLASLSASARYEQSPIPVSQAAGSWNRSHGHHYNQTSTLSAIEPIPQMSPLQSAQYGQSAVRHFNDSSTQSAIEQIPQMSPLQSALYGQSAIRHFNNSSTQSAMKLTSQHEQSSIAGPQSVVRATRSQGPILETRRHAVPHPSTAGPTFTLHQSSHGQGQLVDPKTTELWKSYQDLKGPHYNPQHSEPQPSSISITFPASSLVIPSIATRDFNDTSSELATEPTSQLASLTASARYEQSSIPVSQAAAMWSQRHGRIFNDSATQSAAEPLVQFPLMPTGAQYEQSTSKEDSKPLLIAEVLRTAPLASVYVAPHGSSFETISYLQRVIQSPNIRIIVVEHSEQEMGQAFPEYKALLQQAAESGKIVVQANNNWTMSDQTQTQGILDLKIAHDVHRNRSVIPDDYGSVKVVQISEHFRGRTINAGAQVSAQLAIIWEQNPTYDNSQVIQSFLQPHRLDIEMLAGFLTEKATAALHLAQEQIDIVAGTVREFLKDRMGQIAVSHLNKMHRQIVKPRRRALELEQAETVAAFALNKASQYAQTAMKLASTKVEELKPIGAFAAQQYGIGIQEAYEDTTQTAQRVHHIGQDIFKGINRAAESISVQTKQATENAAQWKRIVTTDMRDAAGVLAKGLTKAGIGALGTAYDHSSDASIAAQQWRGIVKTDISNAAICIAGGLKEVGIARVHQLSQFGKDVAADMAVDEDKRAMFAQIEKVTGTVVDQMKDSTIVAVKVLKHVYDKISNSMNSDNIEPAEMVKTGNAAISVLDQVRRYVSYEISKGAASVALGMKQARIGAIGEIGETGATGQIKIPELQASAAIAQVKSVYSSLQSSFSTLHTGLSNLRNDTKVAIDVHVTKSQPTVRLVQTDSLLSSLLNTVNDKWLTIQAQALNVYNDFYNKIAMQSSPQLAIMLPMISKGVETPEQANLVFTNATRNNDMLNQLRPNNNSTLYDALQNCFLKDDGWTGQGIHVLNVTPHVEDVCDVIGGAPLVHIDHILNLTNTAVEQITQPTVIVVENPTAAISSVLDSVSSPHVQVIEVVENVDLMLCLPVPITNQTSMLSMSSTSSTTRVTPVHKTIQVTSKHRALQTAATLAKFWQQYPHFGQVEAISGEVERIAPAAMIKLFEKDNALAIQLSLLQCPVFQNVSSVAEPVNLISKFLHDATQIIRGHLNNTLTQWEPKYPMTPAMSQNISENAALMSMCAIQDVCENVAHTIVQNSLNVSREINSAQQQGEQEQQQQQHLMHIALKMQESVASNVRSLNLRIFQNISEARMNTQDSMLRIAQCNAWSLSEAMSVASLVDSQQSNTIQDHSVKTMVTEFKNETLNLLSVNLSELMQQKYALRKPNSKVADNVNDDTAIVVPSSNQAQKQQSKSDADAEWQTITAVLLCRNVAHQITSEQLRDVTAAHTSINELLYDRQRCLNELKWANKREMEQLVVHAHSPYMMTHVAREAAHSRSVWGARLKQYNENMLLFQHALDANAHARENKLKTIVQGTSLRLNKPHRNPEEVVILSDASWTVDFHALHVDMFQRVAFWFGGSRPMTAEEVAARINTFGKQFPDLTSDQLVEAAKSDQIPGLPINKH